MEKDFKWASCCTIHVDSEKVYKLPSGSLTVGPGQIFGDIVISPMLFNDNESYLNNFFRISVTFKDLSGKVLVYAATQSFFDGFFPQTEDVVTEWDGEVNLPANLDVQLLLDSRREISLRYTDGHTEKIFLKYVDTIMSINFLEDGAKMFLEMTSDDIYQVTYSIPWARSFGLLTDKEFYDELLIQGGGFCDITVSSEGSELPVAECAKYTPV